MPEVEYIDVIGVSAGQCHHQCAALVVGRLEERIGQEHVRLVVDLTRPVGVHLVAEPGGDGSVQDATQTVLRWRGTENWVKSGE